MGLVRTITYLALEEISWRVKKNTIAYRRIPFFTIVYQRMPCKAIAALNRLAAAVCE